MACMVGDRRCFRRFWRHRTRRKVQHRGDGLAGGASRTGRTRAWARGPRNCAGCRTEGLITIRAVLASSATCCLLPCGCGARFLFQIDTPLCLRAWQKLMRAKSNASRGRRSGMIAKEGTSGNSCRRTRYKHFDRPDLLAAGRCRVCGQRLVLPPKRRRRM